MDIISRHLRLEEIESFSHREIPTLCLFWSESRGFRCNFQHEKEEELVVPAMPVSTVSSCPFQNSLFLGITLNQHLMASQLVYSVINP